MVQEVVQSVQTYVYDILLGIITLLVGFVIGVLAKKFMLRMLHEIALNRIMSKVGVTHDLENIISIALSYIIYLFTIILFLDQLGIKSIVLYLIAGAILMLLILTILVGLKDVIPNFIGWLFLRRNDLVQEGRKVEIRGIEGRVERIGYLETEIKTEGQDHLYVPNSLFLRSKWKMKHS